MIEYALNLRFCELMASEKSQLGNTTFNYKLVVCD